MPDDRGVLPGRDDLPPNEPYYTSKHAFGYSILGGKEDVETVSVGGHLCTAADIIVRGIQLPRAEVGDILVVDKAGSYAYALSPVQFSGHPAPYQVMLTRDGAAYLRKTIPAQRAGPRRRMAPGPFGRWKAGPCHLPRGVVYYPHFRQLHRTVRNHPVPKQN